MTRKTEKNHQLLSRLAESEVGGIRKDWRNRIRIALVYPNTSRVGMSNLGFQTVYRLFNAHSEVVCERAFLPEDHWVTSGPVVAQESARPLLDFDIIAFSLSFENDYPNILSIFERAGIPPASVDRGDPLPLFIAGGVACMSNPEPIAAFIDCFLIGEAEVLIPSFLDHFDPSLPRTAQLGLLSRNVPGAYVPAFYRTSYTPEGLLSTFDPIDDVPPIISRVYVPDISQLATCTTILTSETVFDSAFLIEVSRGCPHGCRFCSAGYVYRPYRYRSLSTLERCLIEGKTLTDKVGLVGTAVSDLPDIDVLCQKAVREGIHLSFSSLRADKLSAGTLSALRRSGTKTATIAPDAGSQRMRDVINKGIREEDVLDAAQSLVEHDIHNIKLYFMIGLPTETMDDVDAVVTLCRQVKERFLASSRKKARIGEISVSLSPFVPKPVTPFQWAGMDGMGELKQKIKRIRTGLKRIANVKVHADTPRWAYVQALFSRGDRRTAQILTAGHVAQGNWAKVFKASRLDPDFYVGRHRSFDERLPWDFIDHGISKAFLRREYERALAVRG